MNRAQRAPRRERRDVVALSEIRTRRALVAPNERTVPRGAYYVIPGHEDNPSQVYSVTRHRLVLRSRDGGFSIFEGEHRPDPEWWHDAVPPKLTSLQVREYHARRRGERPPT